MSRIAGLVIGALCVAQVAAAAPKPKHKAIRHSRATRTSSHHAYLGPVPDVSSTPAYHYAQLSPEDCEAELTARQIEFEREPHRGSLDSVRLGGPLHGVTFRTDLSESARATSPWELADCRLVLALDDFAAQLALHDVVEVRHYSIYRSPSKSWPEDKIGIQHIGGLAIDAASFVKSDGHALVVDRDFHGSIGARTCGKDAAPRPATPDALELRAILCDAVDAHLFNVVLTPNHNRAHHNHFHLEVMAGVRWFMAD